MTSQEELAQLIECFEQMTTLFVRGSDGFFLQTDDKAEFKRRALEATTLLDEVFGGGNTYTANIVHTINTKSGGFIGGPSLACAKEVRSILQAAVNQVERQASRTPAAAPPEHLYVNPSRIEELRAVQSKNHDLSRLIRLCEELNLAHANHAFMSVAFVVRAMIDHVSPIFGVRTFSQVANNYAGPQSFKAAMAHLDNSLRNAADSFLHV
jgi:hypothetical protein